MNSTRNLLMSFPPRQTTFQPISQPISQAGHRALLSENVQFATASENAQGGLPQNDDLFFKSRAHIASFFRRHRVASGLTIEQVRDSLSLESIDVVAAYESGTRAIPLDDVFSLTNLLNIPPEDVLALIVDSTSQQGPR